MSILEDINTLNFKFKSLKALSYAKIMTDEAYTNKAYRVYFKEPDRVYHGAIVTLQTINRDVNRVTFLKGRYTDIADVVYNSSKPNYLFDLHLTDYYQTWILTEV